MPIIETRGALSSRGYGQFAQGAAAPTAGAFIEDVFSTTLYTGTGAAQSIPNGIRLAAGATSAGWIGTLGGDGTDIGYSVAVDSSGNVYVCGQSNASGTIDFIVAKYNASGVIQWQRRLGGSGSGIGLSVSVDSSGNVYVCGRSSASGTNDFIIAKYDTSGAIQWQRRLGGSGSDQGKAVALDSSGNVYVCGASNASGTNNFIIAKYSTSGVIQWQRSLGGSGDNSGRSVSVDSSGNVYVCGYSDASGTYNFIIAKYNTSGVIQWQRRLGGSGSFNGGESVSVDSSGNVYVCGSSDASGTNDFIVAKYDTSGAIQWQRRLGGAASEAGLSVSVDSSGNVYVCGRSSASGTNDFIIAKYDTSGAIQWQRSLGESGAEEATSVAVDSSGNVYVCGMSDVFGTNNLIVAKLPGDGSGTGAYNVGGATFVYAPSTLTNAVSTLTGAASTLTDAASTLTDAASTLTDSATTLNSSITPLAQGAGLGGLVWMKGRSGATDHALYDTARGATLDLVSNSSAAQTTETQGLTAFLGSGFSIGTLAKINTNAAIYAAWTFAEQPKFFDVVTYTGNGTTTQVVNHSLGSAPGMIIAKRTDSVSGWAVWHRGNGTTSYGLFALNDTSAATANFNPASNPLPSATQFYPYLVWDTANPANANGGTYVAYLFAHNAGGFGLSGTDNVISCGSYVGTNAAQNINLGYEPQWLLIKAASGPFAAQPWMLMDTMRGLPGVDGQNARRLYPNNSSVENDISTCRLTSTGFQVSSNQDEINNSSNTYIYIAIRRGPMRTPTLGTNVFMPTVYTGTNVNNRLVNTSVAPDMVWMRQRNDTVLTGMVVGDRLRGQPYLLTGSTAAEVTSATAFDQQLVSATEYGTAFSAMNGVYVGTDATAKLNVNTTANNHIAEAFRRAPGFFDVVCYTGDGTTGRNINHNLGVTPELIILKSRNGSGTNWFVNATPFTNWANGYPCGFLNLTDAIAGNTNIGVKNVTSTVFEVNIPNTNTSNPSFNAYVAYLFASCPGVSKVGTYTGTGSTVQVNCGFTAGARFVLIKRTDAVGSWYVWDSARGIIAGNDPYLVLNSTAAEVTSTDWVDTLATGFEVSNAGSNLVNVNGASYIFLSVS